MRKFFKKNKLFATLAILFSSVLLLSNFVFAATDSSYLIKVGTGQYAITVTNDTTVDQITAILGDPKLTTASAFGGQAYAFYTDDKYSNYLYLETNAEGKIASYGSIDPSFQTPNYSYDSAYNYQDNSIMRGCLFNVSSKVKGGIFYNRNLYWPSTTQFLKNYENTYLDDEVLYSYGLSKQSVTMFNAISKTQGYTNSGIVFDDEIFYRNAQLKELGTDLRSMAVAMNKSDEVTAVASLKENIDITSSYYALNPLLFAMSASSAKTKDFGEKNLAIFDYNSSSKILYTGTTLKNVLQKDYQDVAYTTEENNKLQAGRELYAKAITGIGNEGEAFAVAPEYDEASGLVAGEMTTSAKQGYINYLNAVRVAGGLPKVSYDEATQNTAQHKATLLAFMGTMTHYPTRPAGVTDDFWNVTQSNGNIYTPIIMESLSQNFTMQGAIKSWLDDSSNVEANVGHREMMLAPYAGSFGFGTAGRIAAAEATSTTSGVSTVISAWPSNGVTFMETLQNKKFRWHAYFYKDYTVQNNTTVTVKCLNNNQIWSFLQEEGTYSTSRAFKIRQKSGGGGIMMQNMVEFYDSAIVPQAGFVYEITVHNLLDDATNKNTDYTYRAVFENADPANKITGATSLKIKVPEEITKDSSNNYLVGVGQEIKLSLNASTDSKYTNWMMNWTSSNSEVVEVTQNGVIKVKSFTDSPVKIEVTNPQSGLKDSITILPVIKDAKLTLDKTSYQLNTVNETVKLNATLSGVNMTGIVWKSSNDTIATVSQNGTVTARNGGFVTISASLANYGTVTCNIYVAILRPLSDGSKAYPGDLNRDGAINATDASEVLNWYNKSSLTDDEIAVADIDGDGRVTSTDSSYILDMYRQGSSFMPGQYKPISSVTISNSNLSLDPKQIIYLTARYLPSDTTDSPTFVWKSSNQNVATVDNNGRVVAIAGGTATITATADNGRGKSAQCTITVSGDPLEIEISSITLSNAPTEMTVGDSANLSTSILPENTTQDRTVVWSSSKDSVISVDANGKITAKAAGTATITATTKNGKTAQCTIIVKEKTITPVEVPITSVKLDKTQIELEVGSTVTIKADVLPANTTINKTVTWSTSNSEIITIDSNGKITARAAGSATITVKTSNGKTASCAVTVRKATGLSSSGAEDKAISTTAVAHVQYKGWMDAAVGDAIIGTQKQSLRMEAIKISLINQDVSGDVEYRTHIQNLGWEKDWKKNGEISGTSHQSLRIEAIQIRLTGDLADKYDIYYRVHAQNLGWLDWAKNGEQAGTAGYSYRAEAIQIKIVRKGSDAPGEISRKFVATAKYSQTHEMTTSAEAHVQDKGWMSPVVGDNVIGTQHLSLRVEAIRISLMDQQFSGNIEYRTHIQYLGWENVWKKNGEMSGTSHRSLRVEAIQIRLTGELANKYDIYYRVHVQNFGWLGWAKNGEQAGTTGYEYRAEAIQIKIVKKGDKAPGTTASHFITVR